MIAQVAVVWGHLSSPEKTLDLGVSTHLPAAPTQAPFKDCHFSSTTQACPTLAVQAGGVQRGPDMGTCHGRLAKQHPVAPQLCPQHVEVSLGMCLAKPEEHR